MCMSVTYAYTQTPHKTPSAHTQVLSTETHIPDTHTHNPDTLPQLTNTNTKHPTHTNTHIHTNKQTHTHTILALYPLQQQLRV